MLSAVAKGIRIGRTPGGKPRRRPRKLTTSQAAIRRFEMMKRRRKQDQGTGRGKPKTPKPVGKGPVGRGPRKPTPRRGGGGLGRVLREVGRQAVGPRRRKRVDPSRRRSPQGTGRAVGRKPTKLTTSQAAIARFKAMRGRRGTAPGRQRTRYKGRTIRRR